LTEKLFNGNEILIEKLNTYVPFDVNVSAVIKIKRTAKHNV
jgi:hypothetical protein